MDYKNPELAKYRTTLFTNILSVLCTFDRRPFEDEEYEFTGELETSSYGYQLKANYVIHTVGPVYGKDDNFLLECCYRNCLDLAKEKEIHSIAFPAISTGKYCFPKEKAMEIAIRTVTEWKNRNNDYKISVVFSCIDKRIYQYACEWLEKVKNDM